MKVWLAVCIAVITAMLPTTTLAQTGCNQFVVDEVGVLGDRFPMVEAKAIELASLGVEVRVRITDTSHTSSDGARYQEILQNQCSSWRSEDGGRRQNLLSVLVIIDEHGSTSWIYFGRDWRAPLDSTWNKIRTQHMSPKFRQRQWSDGLEAGLIQLTETIRSYQTPQEASKKETGMEWWMWLLIAGGVIFLVIVICAAFAEDKPSGSSNRSGSMSSGSGHHSSGSSGSYRSGSSSGYRTGGSSSTPSPSARGSGNSSRRRREDSSTSDGGSSFIYMDTGSQGGSSGYSGGYSGGGYSGGGDSGGGGGGGDGGGGGGGGD